MKTVLLLAIANVFITFAWRGHLTGHCSAPLRTAPALVFVSRGR